MSDTPYQPAPPPAKKGLPPFLANLSDATLQWVTFGAAVVAIISLFLPWRTLSVDFGGFGLVPGAEVSDSVNGFGGGHTWAGVLLLLLGLAIAALAFIKARRITIEKAPWLNQLPWFTEAALAGAFFLIAFIAWIDALGETGSGFGAKVSTGIGIWLVLLSSLVIAAAAALPIVKRRLAPTAPTA